MWQFYDLPSDISRTFITSWLTKLPKYSHLQASANLAATPTQKRLHRTWLAWLFGFLLCQRANFSAIAYLLTFRFCFAIAIEDREVRFPPCHFSLFSYSDNASLRPFKVSLHLSYRRLIMNTHQPKWARERYGTSDIHEHPYKIFSDCILEWRFCRRLV